VSVRTPVYLDHQATTPLDSRVLDRMLPVLRGHFGNPASASHAFGWAAARLVETAREETAALIGAEPREIVFTGGATESINLALKGVAAGRAEGPGAVVATNIEHPAVDRCLDRLAVSGWRVDRVPCGPDGVVDARDVAAVLKPDTVIVTLIAAQNEIGTLQPVREVGALCREHGALLHVDAAQAAGKVPVDVDADGIDLLSFSAHKLYGPKGSGALYLRRRRPRIPLAPLLDGGGQEGGLRSGTLNVPGIVGLGEACRLAGEEMADEARRLCGLRDRLLTAVRGALPDVVLNGDPRRRLPGNLNLSFPGVDGAALVSSLPVLALSSGAACSSGGDGPSPVLKALGRDDALARASLRLGLGRGTTAAEVDFAAERIVAAVLALRAGRR